MNIYVSINLSNGIEALRLELDASYADKLEAAGLPDSLRGFNRKKVAEVYPSIEAAGDSLNAHGDDTLSTWYTNLEAVSEANPDGIFSVQVY